MMGTFLFLALVVGLVFAVDIGRRWWQQNEWKRRWRHPRKSDSDPRH